MSIREIEIQEQLAPLYEQLEAFDEPTPSDAPFEYEFEEFELWEKRREQIRILEHELAEISTKGAEVTANSGKAHASGGLAGNSE